MKLKKIAAITAILMFFMAMPAIGLIYFWQDMHRKIQSDASVPVKTLAQEAMATWDDEFIGRRLGAEVDLNKMDSTVAELRTKYGPLKTLGEGTNPKTWAHEFKDQAWQFARFDYPAEFEKGRATVRFTGTRLYLEKTWKIADIEIVP